MSGNTVVTLAPGRRLHPGVTIKANDSALGIQLVVSGCDRNHGRGVLRIGHLAGHKLAPDQLVQALGVALHAFECGLEHVDIRGTNRLVRLLRPLLGRESAWAAQAGTLGESSARYSPGRPHRFGAQVGGVGPHVGDVAGLIEALRHHHGLLHAETQPGTGRLLQGRGDKGRRGLGSCRLVLALADRIGQLLPARRSRPGYLLHCRGGNFSPRCLRTWKRILSPCCCRSAWTSQYSSGTKAWISRSRSTIRRTATDCTRPAESPRATLAHSRGDTM